MFEFAILLIFPAMMAFAAASDLFTMTISNRVSLVLVAGFMVLAIVTGMSWPTIGMHVAAGFLVLSIGFVCFAFGWMGGGDAKLAASTALWLGWSQLLDYAIWASLFGGVLTLGLLALRRAPAASALPHARGLVRAHHRREDRHSLRDCARRGRAHSLSFELLDDRRAPLKRPFAILTSR